MSSDPDPLHQLQQAWAAGALGDAEFLRLAAAEWSSSEDPCALLTVAAMGGRSESVARAVLLTALTLVSGIGDEFRPFRLREQDALLRACRAVEGKEQPFFLPLAPATGDAVPVFVERASRAALRCGLLVYRSPYDLERALQLGVDALLLCISEDSPASGPGEGGLPASVVAGIVRTLAVVPKSISLRTRRKLLGSVAPKPATKEPPPPGPSRLVRRGREQVIYTDLPDDLPFPERVRPYSG